MLWPEYWLLVGAEYGGWLLFVIGCLLFCYGATILVCGYWHEHRARRVMSELRRRSLL